jgi:uroporphyrin-III C-methyltransferase
VNAPTKLSKQIMTAPLNSINPKTGKVYLVGAGPGAADLITVRGAKLLARADIVFHDALVEQEMLALCPDAVLVPVGKRCGKLSSAQEFINKRLIDAAQKYQTVVRLKGGDPMLFGRADEELQALKLADISVEVVPGITAALAGAASIQQSLTLRGVSRSVAFITLAQGSENLVAGQPMSNPNADTLVYYMGRKDAARIALQLIEHNTHHGANTPVQILEAVSTSRERQWIGTLAELAAGKANTWFDSGSPALLVIGQALEPKTLHATLHETHPELQSGDSEINDSLQDSGTLSHSRRRA